MTTWRGHKCCVGLCGKWASLDVRTLPVCYEHGLEIARAYTPRIMADQRRESLDRLERVAERREEAQVSRGNRTGDVVYYARIGGYVKIGYSSRLRNRFTTLRADELLAYEPGGLELERQRHAEFNEERIHPRRENFRPSDRLDAHISLTRETHGLPSWATLPDTAIVTVRRIGEPK